MSNSRLFGCCGAFGCLLCLAARLWACANDYEDHVRHTPLSAASTPQQYASLLQQRFSVSDEEFQRKFATSQSGRFQDISDYAVALLRRGEYQKARDLLEPLAAKYPDEYIIAANLGTAYELTGDVPNALKWIRRGIELNPQAHDGTEWLHVKLLEAKQAAAQDPQWFETHEILAADHYFGDHVSPATKMGDTALFDLRKALEYQLHERLGFVKEPDLVVANLLLSLGNVLVLTREEGKAHEVFKLAKQYDASMNPLIEEKIARYKPKDPSKEDGESWLLPILKQYKFQVIAAGVVLSATLVYCFRNLVRRAAIPRG